MTGSLHKNPLKRKRSTSPSRKKVRTGDAPEAMTPATPVATQPSETDLLAEFLLEIGEELSPPPALVGTPTVAQTVPAAPAPATGPKPVNPFAGKVKELRSNFGSGFHDVAHFQPTRNKSHHGVWDGKRKKVQAWVRMAVDSIFNDDGFVVASKPGKDGGYTYLIYMDGTTVGYLSGSSVPPGQKPEAKHIEVYLDKKGNTVSAFPSSPDVF